MADEISLAVQKFCDVIVPQLTKLNVNNIIWDSPTIKKFTLNSVTRTTVSRNGIIPGGFPMETVDISNVFRTDIHYSFADDVHLLTITIIMKSVPIGNTNGGGNTLQKAVTEYRSTNVIKYGSGNTAEFEHIERRTFPYDYGTVTLLDNKKITV